MPESPVEKYFRGESSSLFHWANDGQELSWLDGTTIAFREEIVVVLDRLALGCLPSLASVVIATAALRQSWPEVVGRLSRVLRALQHSAIPSYSDAMRRHEYLTQTWPESAGKLDSLGRYARSARASLADRAELLARVFERLESRWSAEEQREIATAFRAGLPAEWLFERSDVTPDLCLPDSDAAEEKWRQDPPLFHRVLHDFLNLLRVARVIAGGLGDDDEGSLYYRAKTGVSQELQAPEVDLLPDARTATRGLLNELSVDPELGGLANLARQLMAGISLPRPLETSDDQPTGGVSDISNRGQLDKLLLSELAHDDTTLAARVALNEALYLRRESPPQPQSRVRPVFIDTSLPMWGIPKLYATAVAMALQASAGGQVRCDCWRPDGDDVTTVNLTSRETVAEHLSVLSPTEHSSHALPAWQRTLRDSDEPLAEPVLITSEDALANATFRRSLEELGFPDMWLITPERDGRLVVHHRTRQGLSVYRRIELPLDEILEQPAEVRNGDAFELPAIFGLSKFPLRLSHQSQAGRIWPWGSRAISISDDGRCLVWDVPKWGACELLGGLRISPSTNGFVVERSASCFRLLLSGRPGTLISITLRGFNVTQVDVDHQCDLISGARLHADTLLVFGQKDRQVRSCSAVSPLTGEHLGETTIDVRSQNDRCILYDDDPDGGWKVISWNGSSFDQERLPAEYQTALSVCETSAGRFVRITENNELVDSENVSRFSAFQVDDPARKPQRLGRFIPGGQWLIAKNPNESMILHMEDGTVRAGLPRDYAADRTEFAALRHLVKIRTPHWKFATIGVASAGVLRLTSASGKLFQIALVNGHVQLFPFHGPRTPQTHMIPFVRSRSDMLQPAQWSGGGRAWLDKRGLLHLKSPAPALPQVTFVMRDGPLSGWISTGQLFGDDYYCGAADSETQLERISPNDAWKSVLQPLLQSLHDTSEFDGTMVRTAPSS